VLAALLLAALAMAWPSPGIAGTGWYLMGPPTERIPADLNVNTQKWPTTSWSEVRAKLLVIVPLSTWATYAAFDRAEACEADRETRKNLLGPGLTGSAGATREYWSLSFCVASDDPRLR
jgi:hypothetical protein